MRFITAKFNRRHFAFAALLVALAAGPAQAGDAVEDLLSGIDPKAEAASPLPRELSSSEYSVIVGAEAPASAVSYDAGSYEASQDQWNQAAEAVQNQQSPQVPVDDGANPVTPFNAVPEPSAILLALAALVYFLIFGRRQRVV